MKKTFALLTLLASVVVLQAQITVADYEMKLTADLDNLEAIATVEASSDCGEVISTIDDKVFSGGCAGTLVRTYTFTDDCGNEASAQQFISLIDNAGPVFEAFPENTTASADALPAAPELTAKDNSGQSVKISMEERKENDRVVRIWTAEDPCGNTTIRQQIIGIDGI